MELERAVIEVFGGCNYSCSMCPQSSGRGSNWTRKMPLEMFERILDQLPGKPIINLEGSGEPTLAKDLPKYIEACTQRGLKSFMYSNGTRFFGKFMEECIDAGLTFARFSCIGYNRELYHKWMSRDMFDKLQEKITAAKAYIEKTGSKCKLSSYHLILDNEQSDHEVEQYRKNFVDKLGITGYIWKMHNWSGNYDPVYGREAPVKRTCGRPFAPEITIRAGGLNGLQGAVTPCCQTMGPPNEDISVLGHFETENFKDIWFGDEYTKLRKAHETGDWPDYCKNCDFLIDDPNVLVWSNDPEAKAHKMLGTQFDLNDYRQ